MNTEVDFSNVKDKEQKTEPRGPYLEDGIYEVRVISSELKNSQRSGKPMLVVGFEIMSESHKNKKFTIYFMLNVALWKLKQLNKAIGLEIDGMVKINPDNYIDRDMKMDIHISRDQAHRVICREIQPLEKAPF